MELPSKVHFPHNSDRIVLFPVPSLRAAVLYRRSFVCIICIVPPIVSTTQGNFVCKLLTRSSRIIPLAERTVADSVGHSLGRGSYGRAAGRIRVFHGYFVPRHEIDLSPCRLPQPSSRRDDPKHIKDDQELETFGTSVP